MRAVILLLAFVAAAVAVAPGQWGGNWAGNLGNWGLGGWGGNWAGAGRWGGWGHAGAPDSRTLWACGANPSACAAWGWSG